MTRIAQYRFSERVQRMFKCDEIQNIILIRDKALNVFILITLVLCNLVA